MNANQTSPEGITWKDLLFTHNPFYVISAVLTLYGLHVSFHDNLDPTRGWLQLQLFLGYIALLATTGVFIVRYGRVWEDARTLFLLILLLFIALSISFDRVCLDNEYLGMQFLAVSLGASLVVCEFVLRALAVRLPWAFRLALYAQLIILFCYPPWLGHLSLTDQVESLGWFTLGFPACVALSNLLLLPAAHRRARDLRNNGTPWRWPMYPWTLFVMMWIGVVIRAWTLSYSFDPTKGFKTGFQAYFLVPLLLSIVVLAAEACVRRGDGKPWWRFVLTPFLAVTLSFPGQPNSGAQSRYLELLQETIGSPIQITAVLLVVYFGYLMMKGLRTADWGLVVSLGIFSVASQETLELRSLGGVAPLPAIAGGLLLTVTAFVRRSTERLCAAAILGELVSWRILDDGFLASANGYAPLHLLFLGVLLIGCIFDDRLGRFMRRWAPTAMIASALVSLLTYRHLFADVALPWHSLYAVTLSAIAARRWMREGRLQQVAAGIVCLATSAVHLAEYFIASSLNYVALRGQSWIVWGAAFFLVGLVVSIAKAGHFRMLSRAMQKPPLNMSPPSEE